MNCIQPNSIAKKKKDNLLKENRKQYEITKIQSA